MTQFPEAEKRVSPSGETKRSCTTVSELEEPLPFGGLHGGRGRGRGYSNTAVIRVKGRQVKVHKMGQSESLVQDTHSPKCLDASCSVVPHIPNLREREKRKLRSLLETTSTWRFSLHDPT